MQALFKIGVQQPLANWINSKEIISEKAHLSRETNSYPCFGMYDRLLVDTSTAVHVLKELRAEKIPQMAWETMGITVKFKENWDVFAQALPITDPLKCFLFQNFSFLVLWRPYDTFQSKTDIKRNRISLNVLAEMGFVDWYCHPRLPQIISHGMKWKVSVTECWRVPFWNKSFDWWLEN